jgi:hypothetical protein
VAEPLAKVFEEKAAKKITTVTIEAASLRTKGEQA